MTRDARADLVVVALGAAVAVALLAASLWLAFVYVVPLTLAVLIGVRFARRRRGAVR